METVNVCCGKKQKLPIWADSQADVDNMYKEVNRATKFFFGQLRKGWTIEEALTQVENAYGKLVHLQTMGALYQYANS